MEILQLKYFCDAAETENFSRTAEKHRVPASNISQTIHRLEKELGTELFEHRSNSILLNEAGRLFYENVRQALELISSASVMVKDVGVCGEIKLLVLANRRIVTDTIENFRKLYPQVSFSISHTQSSDDYDLVITAEKFDSKIYAGELFVDEDILLAMNLDNTLANTDVIEPDNLKNQRFIAMNSGIISKLSSMLGFEPNVVIKTDDPFYVRKYVEMGLGIALYPSVSWKGQFSDKVVCKSIGGLHRKTYVIRKKDRYLTKASKIFYDMLMKSTVAKYD